MFTGLIQKTGKVIRNEAVKIGGKMQIQTMPSSTPVQPGESISVQGACLTVTSYHDDILRFDLLSETYEKTNLRDKKSGQMLNLERSLKHGDRLGGHIVQGHVDGMGEIKKIVRCGRDYSFEISCDPQLLDDMVFKGSIAIDGVSLTIAEVKAKSFIVHVIPHTWEHTSFQDIHIGDRVNIETDVLSKYVRRTLSQGHVPQDISWEKLRAYGFYD